MLITNDKDDLLETLEKRRIGVQVGPDEAMKLGRPCQSRHGDMLEHGRGRFLSVCLWVVVSRALVVGSCSGRPQTLFRLFELHPRLILFSLGADVVRPEDGDAG